MKSLLNSNTIQSKREKEKILDFSMCFRRSKFARAKPFHKHQVYHSIIIPSSLTSFKETQRIFVSDRMRACEGGSVQLNICSIHVTLRKILTTSGKNKFDSGAWAPSFTRSLSACPIPQTPGFERVSDWKSRWQQKQSHHAWVSFKTS